MGDFQRKLANTSKWRCHARKPVGSYEDFENVVLKKLTLNCTGKNDSNFLTDAGYVDSKALVKTCLAHGYAN